MHRTSLNTLFTSVGRRVELMRAFRRAYDGLSLGGSILATDIDPLAPALREVDRPQLVPCTEDPAFVPALVEICRRESVDVVFPLIDPDIVVLAEHRDAFDAIGTRLAVVPYQAAQVTADKWLTTELFGRIGLRAPKSWLPDEVAGSQTEYPLFIKPRRGSASMHTHRAETAKELDFFLDRVPDPVVQEFLPGPEITTDVICDLDGELLGVVSRQRIEVRGGEVTKGVTVMLPDVVEASRRISRALSAVGPLTLQGIVKDGVLHYTEINARMGGGLPLGIAAGVDAPRWLLSRAAGIPLELPPIGTYEAGLYMSRFDDSLFISEVGRDELERR
jgi:carbamoyl-phosphate synthase large subunit